VKSALPQKSNPTNGSWWIVQIQPKEEASKERLNPTNGSWWIVQIPPASAVTRLDLKYPPTAVGGIKEAI